MEQTKRRTAAVAVFTASSWGTSVLQIFIRLATHEMHIPVPFVSAFRFILGLPLTYAIGRAMQGPGFWRSGRPRLQIRRSAALAAVTVSIIAGGKALKNVALANAYTLVWPAILMLRARLVHKEAVHPLGWLSVVLCLAGVALLALGSGGVGDHPFIGLALILAMGYFHVLMIEQAEVLHGPSVGDSPLCSWFWTGVVGFVLTVFAVVVCIAASWLGHPLLEMPQGQLQADTWLVLGCATLAAVLPQLGYAWATRHVDKNSLAPWGLTQVLPAQIFQSWSNGWAWPNAWEVAGVLVLIAGSASGVQGQKLMKLAKTN